MRQYRGLTKDGKWVYGYYVVEGYKLPKPHFIVSKGGEWNEVIPETVGQFTGLKDKNGKEGYAGDRIVVRDGDYKAIGIVIWCKDAGQWMWEAVDTSNAMTIATGQTGPLWKIFDKQSRYQGEIIGNIHTKEQDNA